MGKSKTAPKTVSEWLSGKLSLKGDKIYTIPCSRLGENNMNFVMNPVYMENGDNWILGRRESCQSVTTNAKNIEADYTEIGTVRGTEEAIYETLCTKVRRAVKGITNYHRQFYLTTGIISGLLMCSTLLLCFAGGSSKDGYIVLDKLDLLAIVSMCLLTNLGCTISSLAIAYTERPSRFLWALSFLINLVNSVTSSFCSVELGRRLISSRVNVSYALWDVIVAFISVLSVLSSVANLIRTCVLCRKAVIPKRRAVIYPTRLLKLKY